MGAAHASQLVQLKVWGKGPAAGHLCQSSALPTCTLHPQGAQVIYEVGRARNPEMGPWVEPKEKLRQGHVVGNVSGAPELLWCAGPDRRKKGGLPGGGVVAAGPGGAAAPGCGRRAAQVAKKRSPRTARLERA